MSTPNSEFCAYFSDVGGGDEYDFKHMDKIDKVNIGKLKGLREKFNLKTKNQRKKFFLQFYDIISAWEGRLVDLRDIFQKEEIECLLSEAATHRKKPQDDRLGKQVIQFVSRAGYKDEPVIDEEGRPLLRRTTALHRAKKNCCDSMVSDLFEIYNRFDVNYTDESGLTHFHVACKFGLVGVVEKFLDAGQDPNCLPRECIDSPLYFALIRRHTNVIELLLKRGADANLANEAGSTPLHRVCERDKDDDESAEKFFEICDDVHQPLQVDARDRLGRTPLLLAVAHGHKKLSRLLLKRGADVNSATKVGSTALHVLCKDRGNNHEMAEMLLKIGRDTHRTLRIDARDELGRTPLHLALAHNKIKLVELLLRNGADPNLVNEEGLAPLHIICQNYSDIDFLKLFFRICEETHRPLQVDAVENLGKTSLHVAVSRRRMKLVEVLLKNGANPNAADVEGSTPLHIMCENFLHNDDVEMFFKICDDIHRTLRIDTFDKLGRTPLVSAMLYGDGSLVELLLKRGADPNLANPDGLTPLYIVAKSFKLDCAIHDVVNRTMMPVRILESKEYKLDQNTTLMIMKLFDEHGLFEKSANLEKYLSDDENFANFTKEQMVIPNLSLYNIIQMPREKAKKIILEVEDPVKFMSVLHTLPDKHRDACIARVNEIMLLREYFCRWSLKFFLTLTRHQLPILCCEKVIENLSNEDLLHLCLAANGQS